MAIKTPILPPKAGYVEVEINGERVYRKIDGDNASSGTEQLRQQIADLQEQILTMRLGG